MTLMTRTALLSTTMAFLATASLAATNTTTHSTKSATSTHQAQDSASGSVTDTDLSGNVDEDTSAISRPSTSGTTSGAIIDQTKTSKKKVKKSQGKKKTMEKESPSTTQSDTSSAYESVGKPTTTQGVTPNDRVGSGEELDRNSSSSTSGGGSGL